MPTSEPILHRHYLWLLSRLSAWLNDGFGTIARLKCLANQPRGTDGASLPERTIFTPIIALSRRYIGQKERSQDSMSEFMVNTNIEFDEFVVVGLN